MTVIAFDGTTLVADGRCTRSSDSSLVSDCHIKLHKVKIKQFGGECVVGLTGATDCIGPFLNHLESNGLIPLVHFKTENPVEDEWFHMRGVAVNKKGECFEFTSDGGWYPVNGCTAIGAGEKIAQHYLLKGCDALTAVIETCTTELSCGGVLLSYDYGTGKFTEHRP